MTPLDRLTLDYTNVLSDAIGSEHGLAMADIEALSERSTAALAAVQARRDQDLRWLDLPHQSAVQQDVLDYAASVQGQFENVVVLGIGADDVFVFMDAFHQSLDELQSAGEPAT